MVFYCPWFTGEEFRTKGEQLGQILELLRGAPSPFLQEMFLPFKNLQLFHFLCVRMFVCACGCTPLVWCPQSSEEGDRSLGTGARDSCESPCRCWELNQEPLQEQQIFSTADPSPEPAAIRVSRPPHTGDPEIFLSFSSISFSHTGAMILCNLRCES